jgi:hypothetical protein
MVLKLKICVCAGYAKEGQHSGVLQIYFEGELKSLEEWIAKPKICEDYIEVTGLSCEDMEDDRNQRVLQIPSSGIEDNNMYQ